MKLDFLQFSKILLMIHGNKQITPDRQIMIEGADRSDWRFIPLYGLWLIAILPKFLQLTFFLLWMAVIVTSEVRNAFRMYRIDFGLAMLVSMVAVHVLSVILNSYGAETERVLAACNTVCIWLISIVLLFSYSRGSVCLRTAAGIAVFNILVGAVLAVISSFADLSFVFLSDERHLNVANWLNGDQSERFVGFLEYSNLISLMYFVMFPLSLYSVRLWKAPLLKYGYCILAMYPVFKASSRSGMMLAVVTFVIAFAYLVHENDVSKSQWKNVLLVGSLLVLLVVVANWGSIVEVVSSLLTSRQGSNTTRSLLYSRSIEDVLDTSPLIGKGIKFTEYPFGDSIPLGSHSTYIGILYKTGIFGLAMWLFAFLFELITLMKYPIRQSNKIFILAFLLVFMVFLAIEDIDGSNWSLVMTFIVAGITVGHCKTLQLEKNNDAS